jgi:hypothetical protein
MNRSELRYREDQLASVIVDHRHLRTGEKQRVQRALKTSINTVVRSLRHDESWAEYRSQTRSGTSLNCWCRLSPPNPRGTAPDFRSGLSDRYPVGRSAPGDRAWQRHDLLAPIARLAGGRRVGADAPGTSRSFGRSRPDRLEASVSGQREFPGEQERPTTGPNPTARSKAGMKRHVVTDRAGTPPATRLTGANTLDSLVFADLLDDIPPIRQPNGHRRKRPANLHADKGDESPVAAMPSPGAISRFGSPARRSSRVRNSGGIAG